MFDVGFSEVMLIAVVALVVIGPERMPGVARTVGALFGRAQRYVNQLKADIQNEMDQEEFNRIRSTFYDAAKSIEHSVNQAKVEIDATAASLNESIAAPSESPAAAAVVTPIHDAAKSIEHSASQAGEELRATAESLNESIAAQSETPTAAAVETQDSPAQMDFWLNSTPPARPAAAAGT